MSLQDNHPTREDIDKIFSKYEQSLEEYEPEGKVINCPKYIPAPKNCGPKPITIEEYKERQQKQKEVKQPMVKKKSRRGGKKLQIKKQRKELLRLIGLTYGQEKRHLYIKLQQLNGEPKIKTTRNHNNQQQ